MREQLFRKGKGDLWTSAVAPLHIKSSMHTLKFVFIPTHVNYMHQCLALAQLRRFLERLDLVS
jgi:hypothetical protein